MLSKKEVKDIQSLGHKKHRNETKLFIAEGPKIVNELIELVPDQIIRVYALREWIINHKGRLHDDFDVIEASLTDLARLTQLQTPNQVLAVIRQFEVNEPFATAFTLYLDAIQDPGNMGTIIRIADWFNVKSIVCSAGCADCYNPKVIQSTMASIARISIYYENDPWLAKQNVPLYAATLDGISIFEHKKVNTGILIIGNESRGIRSELQELATEKITIPRMGSAESLNAAVATGIILSHLL
jgi:TrmH family RNA methyltransferase